MDRRTIPDRRASERVTSWNPMLYRAQQWTVPGCSRRIGNILDLAMGPDWLGARYPIDYLPRCVGTTRRPAGVS